jgi:Xaa-Pro aminopeptidase
VTEPLLLFSRGGEDSDFLYACRMPVEEAVYVRFAEGDDVLVVPELELERARSEARAARIVGRKEAGWAERADVYAAWEEVALHLLRNRGASAARISPRLPAVHYAGLSDRGIRLDIDRALFKAERRRKSADEVGWIRAAQGAAEAACVEVIRLLAGAVAGPDGFLHSNGERLTSEKLMAAAQGVLNERGHQAAEMIVAGSPGCAIPHFRGSGPIRSGAPVIIDIFPRGQASHYHGDLTRTVVPGPVDEWVGRMHEACVQAQAAATAGLRAGADGRDAHRAACERLVELGFGTITAGLEGREDGPRMIHSTGHGVGLDVHEAPHLRDLHYPLAAGDVVTVEPGLYQTGLGGVRVEDTGLVTEGGFDNFTTLPRSLDPEDYL